VQLEEAVLYFHLREQFPVTGYRKDPLGRCARPVFYVPGRKPEGHLVLVPPEQLPQCLREMERGTAVCAAEGDIAVPPTDCNVLLVRAELQEVCNALTQLFDRYDRWDMAMRTAVFENRDFAALLRSCSETLLQNYALLDNNFTYVTYSDSSRRLGYVDQFVTADNRLPLEHVNSLVASPEFHRSEKTVGPFELIVDEHTVDINIFHKDRRVGRLSTIVGPDAAYAAYCKAVFSHLGPYLEILYDRYGDFYTPKQSLSQLHAVMEKLLEGGTADPHTLQDLLSDNGGKPGDVYLAVQLQPGYRSDKNVYADYIVSQLEQMWHGAACIKNNRGVFLLQNVSLFHRQHKESFRTTLACLLRDSLMVAGIGRELRDLSELRVAQKQACIALDLGQKKKPDQWVARFDDFALDYLMQLSVSELPPEQICSPELLKIRDYDRENGTAYLKTLSAYFRCQYNASAAAAALYIHRSTFINRMDRIREIAELPLEDWRTRLYLELSCRILDENGSNTVLQSVVCCN